MKQNLEKYDLQKGVIDFAIDIIRLVEILSSTKSTMDIGGQVLRSGTSPALNYEKAQNAETKRDFIRKMKVCLMELRKTQVGLKEVDRVLLSKPREEVERLLRDCDELVSIFEKSIKQQN